MTSPVSLPVSWENAHSHSTSPSRSEDFWAILSSASPHARFEWRLDDLWKCPRMGSRPARRPDEERSRNPDDDRGGPSIRGVPMASWWRQSLPHYEACDRLHCHCFGGGRCHIGNPRSTRQRRNRPLGWG